MEDDETTTTPEVTTTPAAPPAPPATPPAATPPATEAPAQGAGGAVLTGERLSERLERARVAERNKLLQEEYGTTDAAKIAEIKATRVANEKERARLLRIKEARERGRLTADQQRQRELEEERRKRVEAEERLRTFQTDARVREQDQRLDAIALKHVDPTYLEYARRDLAKYLTDLMKSDPKKFRALDDKKLEAYFERYIKERPVFARVAPPAATDEKQPEPPKPPAAPPVKRTVPGTRPAPARATTAATTTAPSKTPRPGQPNSMTKAELKEYYRSKGMTIPY